MPRIPLAKVSVGATHNALMAAVLARGDTLIENAAREPEVADLASCLMKMGAKIERHWHLDLARPGRDEPARRRAHVLPDRIETGTYAMAAAMTGGEVILHGARADLLREALDLLRSSGVEIEETPSRHQRCAERWRPSRRSPSTPSPSQASPPICRRSSSR